MTGFIHRFAFLIISIFWCGLSFCQPSIIPTPAIFTPGEGQFVLDPGTTVESSDPGLQPLADWFKDMIAKAGISFTASAKTNVIRLVKEPQQDMVLGTEGYQLDVTSSEINISSNSEAGIFYGIQSLLQMIPVKVKSNAVSIPACSITDYPRFGWRGLMLDVSRHFFTVDEVKQFIDLMAQYKFNMFHWHLTDDNGWRIEIKSLPKLTEVGACRVERFGTFGERIPPKPGEKATDCNFYKQEQIKEVVNYAKERFVTIVPEIDVPGHSLAAIAAYPELSITKEKQMVNPGSKFSEWYGDGTFKMLLDNTLNPSDEKVYQFLDKVFGEVAGLFPGTFIHAGGDECYHGYWEKSPDVQAFMKKNSIPDVHGLQSYFMKRVTKIIESKGKKMIGWDEILDGGLADGAAVMSWRGMKGGVEAAKQNHPVVMSPTTFAYLDYMQGDASLEPRIYASLYLKTCYDFDPVPQGVDSKLILGGQANLWTEKVANFRHATYMTYPRSWAIAESVWSPPGQKNWNDFFRRTEDHFIRADEMGINVSKAVYDPIVKTKVENGSMTVQIRCEDPLATIHYTIDGSHPDAYSTVYKSAFALPEGPVILRVSTFREGIQSGRTLVLSRDELVKRK